LYIIALIYFALKKSYENVIMGNWWLESICY